MYAVVSIVPDAWETFIKYELITFFRKNVKQ